MDQNQRSMSAEDLRQSRFAVAVGPMTREEREYLLKQQQLLENSSGELYGEPSTLSLDSEDEERIQGFGDEYREQYGHSFVVPALDATVDEEDHNTGGDGEPEVEDQPPPEVLFHVGKETIRAKRSRSVSSPYSPTGCSPRPSKARFSVSKLILPFEDEDDDEEGQDKENVRLPIPSAKLNENGVNSEPIGIGDEVIAEEYVADEDEDEGVVSIHVPTEFSDSPLSSPRLCDNQSPRRSLRLAAKLEASMKNLSFADDSGRDVSQKTKNDFSRNNALESSLYMNISSGLKSKLNVTLDKGWADESIAMIEESCSQMEIGPPHLNISVSVPKSPRTNSVSTRRSLVRQWIDQAASSPEFDCFSTPSPRKVRSQYSSPLLGSGKRSNLSPVASPLTGIRSFEEADKDCSFHVEKLENEILANMPEIAKLNKNRDDEEMKINELEHDLSARHISSDEEDMSCEDFQIMDQSHRSCSSPEIKSSQEDMDDTISQMEKLLALAEELENEDILAGPDQFPDNLPGEFEANGETEEAMDGSPVKPISASEFAKKGKKSESKLLKFLQTKVHEHEAVPLFNAPMLPVSGLAVSKRHLGPSGRVYFDSLSKRAGNSGTRKPAFTSTPHQERAKKMTASMSSPASSIWSPVPHQHVINPVGRKVPIPIGRDAGMLGLNSPVANYIYSTPPMVQIKRAIKHEPRAAQAQGKPGSDKRVIAFGSNIPVLSIPRKSGTLVRQSEPVQVKAEPVVHVDMIHEERPTRPLLIIELKTMSRAGLPDVHGSSDPTSPFPVNSDTGGSIYCRREKGNENSLITSTDRSTKQMGPGTRKSMQLKPMNYFGYDKHRIQADKEKVKCKPTQTLTPKLAIGIPSFVSQRHTGFMDTSGNCSIVQQESVNRKFLPSRIAALSCKKKS